MHIKSVELSHFKSFGGTTKVPLLPGFTVISGPNGSGKSNILDALLFALGLSSSKGMRAERLPDLVNQNQSSRRSTVEASVTVTFDISDLAVDWLESEDEPLVNLEGFGEPDNGTGVQGNGQSQGNGNGHGTLSETEGEVTEPKIIPLTPLREWSVTRRLRVTAQGTYTSNYYINGEPCTMNQLHDQLQRFRIYPEGYNVVLQGDVTSIISMNPRERREIIDELAGVASFDRKIEQAKEKLNVVQEREERFRIVERELIVQRDRLAQDRLKAEKYQALKATLHHKTQWEAVLLWQAQQQIVEGLGQQIEAGEKQAADLAQQITAVIAEIELIQTQLETLNSRVKALGEDEHLAKQSELATQEAELRQLQRQEQDLKAANRTTSDQLRQTQVMLVEQRQTLAQLTQQIHDLETGDLVRLQEARDEAARLLEEGREATSAIALASQAWVQEQTTRRQAIETLRQSLDPQRSEYVRLQERHHQLQTQLQQQTETLATLQQEIAVYQGQVGSEAALLSAEQAVQQLAGAIATAEADLTTQRQTQARLIQEQRDKQRQLDKLEAQAQALQETQGTQAAELLIKAGLPGIHGVVAQIGRVDPKFQLALEIAAGGRLGYLVVDDDSVAASGIALLKQKRAGRATFLPLNAIRAPKFTPLPAWKRPDGFVDYAVNLIDCEPRYRDIFGYVFGSTVVFDSLDEARRNLGQFRIVTLEGEILETSGAMTGGSLSNRQGTLHFGTLESSESAEVLALRQRLRDIEPMLERCTHVIEQRTAEIKQLSQQLADARQHHRELQLQGQQSTTQLRQFTRQHEQLQTQHQQYTEELGTVQTRLTELAEQVPQQEAELQTLQTALTELEQSQTHSEWQQAQAHVRSLEHRLQEIQQALQGAENQLQDFRNQSQRLQERIQQGEAQEQTHRQQQTEQTQQQALLSQQQAGLTQHITQIQAALAELDKTLAAEKANRDRVEYQLRERQNHQQQMEWQRQRLIETQQERRQQLTEQQALLETQVADLPDPLPDIPEGMDLEQVRKDMRSLQKRLEALEPVNMLALEEYNRTQERLDELSQKLGTLQEERTELLLRVENFTTLRCQAFHEAFAAVNKNFQAIFAELSDGDGYLQLDDAQDPFNGGLNLVAHPKGKPVRRLASMSGGEKSLTALSFIFALQRYRPSTFYAFDEVDMFLDGANVERLSRMIRHQAQQAQFVVVSLRRPMIESAERTIGVTQARGAYTQVLGIDLQAKSASM